MLYNAVVWAKVAGPLGGRAKASLLSELLPVACAFKQLLLYFG